MSEEQVSPNPTATGQADAAPWAQGQPAAAPMPPGGQAEAPHDQDAGPAQSPPSTGEPTFFDPANLPPELIPAYKQMQGAFTNKTQEIAKQRQKVEAYDAFMRDPVGQLQALAGQYGLTLTRAQAAQQLQQAEAQQAQEWQPNSWDEVIAKAEERAEQRVLQRLAPYLGQVHQMQASNVEQQLNKIDLNWKEYESAMRDSLTRHPTLVNDVATLYRISVPPEILEAKAIQQALKKYEDKGRHAAVTPGGSAPRSKPAAPQVKSFDDAVRLAKQQISSGEA